MYMHLGKGTMVNARKIIGIFDLDTCTIGKTTKNYLSTAEKRNIIADTIKDLPKSFVICGDKSKKLEIFLSSMTTLRLRRRYDILAKKLIYNFKHSNKKAFAL